MDIFGLYDNQDVICITSFWKGISSLVFWQSFPASPDRKRGVIKVYVLLILVCYLQTLGSHPQLNSARRAWLVPKCGHQRGTCPLVLVSICEYVIIFFLSLLTFILHSAEVLTLIAKVVLFYKTVCVWSGIKLLGWSASSLHFQGEHSSLYSSMLKVHGI